jgi:NTP pyrophosphatase (non-canonical NTP hydrolase)
MTREQCCGYHCSGCPHHDVVVRPRTTEGERAPLNTLARDCHEANATWWHDPATGERLQRNKGELLMLIVSEIAEAMEGERKGLMDDKLPHRLMAEVELADALIRIFDYAGAFGYDLDGAVAEKRQYNATRADHKPAARLAPGGKKW